VAVDLSRDQLNGPLDSELSKLLTSFRTHEYFATIS